MLNDNQYKYLAAEGSFFIYDLDALITHAKILNSGNANLFYACKANPLSFIISILKDIGMGFDVSSEGELHQVVSRGVSGDRIVMTGPAKPEGLLKLGLKNRVETFVIESPSQLSLLQRLAPAYGYEPKILLRLQLQWDMNDKFGLSGGGQPTSLGMDLSVARHLLPTIKLPLLGFHVFQWGNVMSLSKLRDIWHRTIKACKALTQDFNVLDVGGGIGIPYQGEDPLAWGDINALVQDIKQEYHLKEFWIEMGRYMTGPWGTYITKVVDRKQTYGRDILVLEGGINHLARPALGGIAPFPARLLRKSIAEPHPFYLHGPLLMGLDMFGKQSLPQDIKIGDVLAFDQVGAYGFTVSMPYLLCHNLPGEAVIWKGELSVVRKPKPAQSWLI